MEELEVENNPNKPEDGVRTVKFSRELYIEADDFMENPPKKYYRMFEGNEVRLKTAYIVRCTGCKKDENGNIVEIYAEYDPQTRGGNTPDGRKVRGTIHWVDAKSAVDAEVRMYENLFTVENPDTSDKNFLDYLNPDSLKVIKNCKVESGLLGSKAPNYYQFMRKGYFCIDSKDSKPDKLVFNRTVSLKDSYNLKKK